MDIDAHKDFPFARVGVRYYPSSNFGLEFGAGLSTLEADADSLFSTTTIYPVDARLIIHPLNPGKIDPFAFVGFGFTYFNPKDRDLQQLPRNANSEYSHFTGFFPVGVGLHYFVTENTGVGVNANYNYTMSDNLDDIKTGGKDAWWNISLSLFAYLKANNDPDGDKLLNDEEKQIGTDPLNPDTDGEGLKDGEEVHTYHTNPLKKDTDDDELNDKEEIVTYKTDPLRADTDGDGLRDGEEISKYHTDPLVVDTDGEGLSDGDEVIKYHTDPIKKDTDGDSLSDADEVIKYKTDPLVFDTDKGGVDDGKEIQLGLNPLDPSDDVPIIKVGERIILEGVNFQTNKTTLLPQAKTILDQVAQSLLANPTAEVAIHGHTDNVGGAKHNMTLSLGRAEAVKTYIVSRGVPASRIKTKGYGFTKPIADNSKAEGRAKNRRIEFVRIK